MLSSQWFPTIETFVMPATRGRPTPREAQILGYLREQESASMTQMCEGLGVTKNTMRMHMWRLSVKGLVKSTAKGGITARWVAL